MTFPYDLWGCQTNTGDDTRSLSIQQQVCSHSDGIEVERWTASFMISFQPEQNLSLSTITNLILLFSRPPCQSRLLAMRYETTSCPTQNVSSSEVTFYLPVCYSTDILQKSYFFSEMCRCAQCLGFFAMILAMIRISW